jgi:hypothetical protein
MSAIDSENSEPSPRLRNPRRREARPRRRWARSKGRAQMAAARLAMTGRHQSNMCHAKPPKAVHTVASKRRGQCFRRKAAPLRNPPPAQAGL